MNPTTTMPGTQRKTRGFSLIEVMVSGTIFLVGLVGIFSTFNVAVDVQRLAGQRRVAINLTEAMLEELMQRLPSDPALTVGTHDGALERTQHSLVGVPVVDGSPDAFFTVVWTVDTFRNGAGVEIFPGVREVTVLCRWTDNGRARETSLKTWRF